MALSNLQTTRFGDTMTLASRACGREQLTGDEAWGHFCVTIASLLLSAIYRRRGLGTRLRYHRKLVAVSNIPATRFGDTITLPSQACGCEQLTNDVVWGHDYVTIASLCGCEQLTSEFEKNFRVYIGFRVQDDSRLGFKTTRVWSYSYLEYFWLPGPVHAHSQALPRPSP